MKIFVIGPGGVGKSSSGLILANTLDHTFIDLDKEFCKRIEDIGIYIRNKWYEKYCIENSKLFYDLLNEKIEKFVFVVSSGFLVHKDMDELTAKHKKTIQEQGISILLLPSDSLEESTEIVIKRQLSRGFDLNEEREKEKFIQRFKIYREYGDIKIFSHDTPEIIAKQMKEKIAEYTAPAKAAA